MDDDSIKPITNQGFFTYVFRLSRFKQEDLMNIIQYTLISIIPVILFVYFTKKYFPIIDENDSSLYIFTITVIELIFMIIGIFFIDRIINYIPTYSGKYYETINLTTIVVIFILFMLTIETGFKSRTLVMLDRFDKWFFIDDALVRKFGGEVRPFNFSIDEISNKSIGNKNSKNNKNKGAAVNTNNSGNAGSGPRIENMAQQYSVQPPLPTQGPVTQMSSHQVDNFNSMYSGGGGGGGVGSVPQQMGSNTQGGMGGMGGGGDSFMEPMAANAVLGGGSSWSSW